MSTSSSNPSLHSAAGPEMPSDILEMRAVEQRQRLHNTVQELRETVRERVNVRKTARQYLWPAAGTAAVLGLVLGYAAGGAFVR
jgi:hypothetical protein